jgi:hypothetical protein
MQADHQKPFVVVPVVPALLELWDAVKLQIRVGRGPAL